MPLEIHKIPLIVWGGLSFLMLVSIFFLFYLFSRTFLLVWMLFWLFTGLFLFLYMRKSTKAEPYQDTGKKMEFEECIVMAKKHIGKYYRDYLGIDGDLHYDTKDLGKQPSSPIFYVTGKGFNSPKQYYFFAVNMNDALKKVVMRFKENEPFTDKEIEYYTAKLPKNPEVFDIIEDRKDPFTGEITGRKITRLTGEQLAEKEEDEKREMGSSLEGDVEEVR